MSSPGWVRWVLLPLLVVPVSWLLFIGLGRDPDEIPSPLIGQPLPLLVGPTLDGETLSTVKYLGTPMVVNVWASWCIPACVDEHPVLTGAATRYSDQLQVIGVLFNDTPDAARRFLAVYGDGGWPHLTDPDGQLAIDLGVAGPPETYFVDADGIVRAKHIGPLTEADMATLLALIGLGP